MTTVLQIAVVTTPAWDMDHCHFGCKAVNFSLLVRESKARREDLLLFHHYMASVYAWM
jgi:hypothetical protein